MNRANQNQAVPRNVSGRLLLAGLLAMAIPVLVVIIWTSMEKHVWYDEMWSKWMASRELGLGDAARERWFRDVHPPLYYFFNWAMSAFIGPQEQYHRLLNLLWLAGLASIGSYIAVIRPAMRPALVVGAALVLSNHDIILFGEYRSYAASFCSSAALMLLLCEMLQRNRDLSLREDRTLMLLLGGTIMLSLNLHYVSTVICGIVLGVFVLDAIRRRHWRWAGFLIGAGMFATLLLLAILFVQGTYLQGVAQDFWVKPSVKHAARIMATQVAFATGLNVVLIGCLAQELRDRFRGVRDGIDGVPAAGHFAILAALAIFVSCFLLLVINAFKPLILARYLVALSPVAIAPLAMLTAHRITARRWLFGLFLVNAALVSLWFVRSSPHRLGWDDGARRVAAIVEACPETIVYTMWRFDAVPKVQRTPPPNEVPFLTWAMADIGTTYGLAPRFIHPAKPPAPLPLSPGGCPTILWIEHAKALDGVRTARAAGLSNPATPEAAIRTTRTASGTMIELAGSR